MRRTPSWVFVAAAMIQLAGLGLVVYAMERWSSRDDALAVLPTPEPPSSPTPEPDTERSRPEEPAPAWTPADPASRASGATGNGAVRTEVGEMPPPGVRFGPPVDLDIDEEPAAAEASTADTPPWIREGASPTSQLLRGRLPDGWLHVVFHPDRTLKLVDTDGGRYAGRVVDAAADLRETGGTRSLMVRIGVADDGRLQLAFVGGAHDAETVVLDDVVERFA